jgi:integrase
MIHQDRQSTVDNARRAVTRFAQWLGERTIDVPTLDDWRAHVARLKHTPNTRNLQLDNVKACLRALSRRGELGLTPDQIGEALKSFPRDKKLPVVLTKQQIRQLWQACGEHPTGRTVKVLLLTGCRREEALALNEHSITDEGLRIIGTKTRTERLLPWSLLGDARSLLDPPTLTWNRPEWERIRANAGLLWLKAKGLRSTFASYLVSSGKFAPFIVAKLCGHSLQTAEAAYWGMVLGVAGETILEMLGVDDLLSVPEKQPAPREGHAGLVYYHTRDC